MELFHILESAVRMGASDVHLTTDSVPLARVNGAILAIPACQTLSSETCKSLVYSALLEEQRQRFEEFFELDCSFKMPGVVRCRMNVLLQSGCVEAVLRLIPANIPTPEALGLTPAVLSLARLPRGLVLVTGPTGSGKTSTLACLVECINQNERKHILTIEDPIEYVYSRQKSVIRQREVGPHTRSFKEALKHALRQDPDVILVGELRDLETISLALTAAETGHLCLSTLHTQDAAQTIDRIVDVFPEGQQQQARVQLAATLRAVVSQLLLPCADGQGRVAAREVMLATPAISNLIRENKTHMLPGVIETGARLGMTTMDRSLEELVRRGAVAAAEAQARTRHPQKGCA